MPNDPQSQKTTRDDPRQAVEAGDPQHSGHVRGHVANEQEDPARLNPHKDKPGTLRQDRQDGGKPTTPHRESGDR